MPKTGFRSPPKGVTGYFDIEEVRAEAEAEARAEMEPVAHQQD